MSFSKGKLASSPGRALVAIAPSVWEKRSDTLLKIASQFSSAVVRDTHELLLANPLQSSRSTFSRESFPSFFAFKEGMWDTQISALLSSPTVAHELAITAADE